MVKSKPKTVEEVLGKVEPEQKEISQKLRDLVKNAVPDAKETVRRGKITFVLDGKDFAKVLHYKGHVDLGLVAGQKVDSKLLKGTGIGKDVRHIKIASVKKVNEAEIVRLLKEAAELTRL